MATKAKATNKSPRVSRYKGDRKPVTVLLSGAVAEVSKEYFPKTRHGSLSKWLEGQLTRHLREKASVIRQLGLKVPEIVFEK